MDFGYFVPPCRSLISSTGHWIDGNATLPARTAPCTPSASLPIGTGHSYRVQNLTDYALEANMELGLVVERGAAARLAEHFDQLFSRGELTRAPME
jgi:hypothetical protein